MRYLLILLVLLTGLGWAQSLPLTMKTREFQIGYPSDWQQAPANFAQAVFLYPGQGITNQARENLNVQISKVDQGMGMDMFCMMARHEMESDYPGIKIVRSNAVNVGKLKGQRFDYASKDIQIIQLMVFKGELGFTVTFTASPANYKRFSSQAEAMLRSFTVL